MSDLITEFSDTTQSILTDLTAEYYIDISGSTSGSILKYETDLAKKLELYIKRSKIVEWSTVANITQKYPCISSGGTDPSTQ